MRLRYYFKSILTRSYWSYALFRIDSIKTFMAVLGGIWLFVGIFGDIRLIDKNNINYWYLLYFGIFSLLVVIFTRRPLTKIIYNHPGKDLQIEVKIGNLFEVPGQKIIGTNTTFDTDFSNNIISPTSLQGQFTTKYFQTNMAGLDQQIDNQLASYTFQTISKPGKTKEYELGTTIKFDFPGERFYLFAMAEMNAQNNVKTSLKKIHISLEKLWDYIENQGNPTDTVIPLIGSAYGRLNISRKKLIAEVAHSFILASTLNTFVPKLTIVINPKDVEKFELNLFEVKDLLRHYLP